ncbi:MAG TPA: DNA mismatch repair protein MutS [Longimicrobium sp.]|jgi:DNA mismatch repair protein MutS|uniref:DNA mismatch repair protein MutS n=1 Tax=Longimicrobium sp. TaxID=2029185 RepID=UPI002EDA533A
MASEDTPLMLQWREVKARHPDALVFFRVGDFYELFNEDAVEGSKLLDLTLTSRNNGGSKAPLAGIPAHALENYLRKLVGFGKRVAICDQIEDPALAKGLVRRAVTEMVTPGAVFSDALLESRRNNYLAAIAGDAAGESEVGLALADLTTGELSVRRVPWEELTDVLGAWQPAEILLPRTWELFPLPGAGTATLTYRGDWLFDPRGAAEELCRHFRVANLAGYGFETGDQWLAAACGALVGYLAEVQPAGFAGLRPPVVERAGGAMVLDEMTRRNLELVETLRGAGTEGTLLKVLDEACTPMGGRLLRRWLLAPLLKPDHIAARLDAVDEFFGSDAMRRAVRDALGGVRDLERLAIKVGAGRATPREMLALATSLGRLPLLIGALGNAKSSLLAILRDGLEPLDDVREAIERAVDPDAPVSLADGGVIRQGHNADLDELRSIRDGAVDWIARLQASEREATGINTLKIGFNRVFGYYLEVTRAQADRVPDHYHRKQTLANAERYYTPELKEWEEKVLGAEERIGSLEQRLFAELREAAAREVPRIQRVADHVAVVDVLAGLAEVACIRDFVRPVVDGGFALEIRGGRHPVVETMMPREEFIPNDVKLDEDARVMILTGPNMAGKSTVLRQVGLIALLAQVGSFVPARAAHVGVVDRIFTRVGASDNLVRGQSTFMVEMNETAAILHGATPRSLVLLDEIGRGTSTWDGLSVATATTEHLHDQVGAKTIFATHYHELTRLSDTLDGVVNFSVAVREVGEDIVFLRRLVPGGADRSYGVEVARLAGMPETVVARARQVLHELEEQSAAAAGNAPDPGLQLGLFDGGGLPHPAVERLRQVNPDALTPIQALVLLADLVRAARN